MINKQSMSNIKYYSEKWEEKIIEDYDIDENVKDKTILLFSFDDTFFSKFKDKGYNVIVITPGYEFKEVNDNKLEVNVNEEQSYIKLFSFIKDKKCINIKSIFITWANQSFTYDKQKIQTQLNLGVRSIYFISKAIMKLNINNPIRLIYSYNNKNNEPLLESIGTLFKSINLENSNIKGKVIGYDRLENITVDEILIREDILPFNEENIKYIDKKRFIKKMVIAHEKLTSISMEDILETKGIYIITGGLGAIGKVLLESLIAKEEITIIVLGRSELNNENKKYIEKLNAYKGNVIYKSLDIRNENDIKEFVNMVVTTYGDINGIIHCAGILKDSFLVNKNIEDFQDVIDTKIYGAIWFDKYISTNKLKFKIYFSSITSIFGNIGQCDYSFGNRVLDLLSIENTNKSIISKSINWPLWQEGGMKISDEQINAIEDSMGIVPISNTDALLALNDSLSLEENNIIVLPYVNKESKNDKNNELTKIKESKKIIPAEKVKEIIKKEISEEIRLPINRIDYDDNFEKFGIDSVAIMGINRRLEGYFGELPKTLFFQYKNINELSQYFIDNNIATTDKVGGKVTVEEIKPSQKNKEIPIIKKKETNMNKIKFKNNKINDASKAEDDIVIIGIDGKFPKANNLDEFWEVLKNGQDCIEEIPKERWDWKRFSNSGKEICKWGGFLDDIDKFDSLFFNISPREAERMDPQERLFLQTSWKAFEDAGYEKKELRGKKVGVYVSSMYNSYQNFGVELLSKNELIGVGGVQASLANRVSYFFDLNGPSLTLDTMCSSALTSVYLASEAIKSGDIDMALIGGVNVSIHPYKYVMLSEGKFLSRDGRCKAFGKGANGYVPGEGVGAIILKSYKKAIEDNDNIYAIVKSTGINHGGRSNGYTVPSVSAQSQLIKEVLEKKNLNATDISYVEAHGTGTSLGDPIEIDALSEVYSNYTDKKQFCSIGSVKSNIGHLESAAAIASIIKVVLQLKHKMLVPSIHTDELNENINFNKTPFYVQRKLQPWESITIEKDGNIINKPRRAAISAFGAGGANGHIILEEFVEKVEEKENYIEDYAMIFSAKTKNSLKENIKSICCYLEEKDLKSEILDNLSINKDEIFNRILEVCELSQASVSKQDNFLEMGIDYVTLTRLNNILENEYNFTYDDGSLDLSLEVGQYINNISKIYKTVDLSTKEIKESSKNQLDNFMYNLIVRREQMEERIALLVKSKDELISKLNQYLSGEQNIDGLFYGNKNSESKIKVFLNNEAGNMYINKLVEQKDYNLLLQLWVQGVKIDLIKLYEGKNFKNVSLPKYEFEKIHHWINTDSITVSSNNEEEVVVMDKAENRKYLEKISANYDGFYVPSWELDDSRLTYLNRNNKTILFFTDSYNVQIKDNIKEYGNFSKIYTIIIGDEYQKIDEFNYIVNMSNRSEVVNIINSIDKIDSIYYLLCNDKECSNDTYLENEFLINNVYYFIRAYFDAKIKDYKIDINFLTNNAFRVLENEKINVYNAAIYGLIKSLNKEAINLNIRCFDTDNSKFINEIIYENLVDCEWNEKEVICVYRNNKRYKRKLTPIQLSNEKYNLRDNGVYLIIGGLGRIGYQFSLDIAEKTKGKIIIVGRSEIKPEIQEKLNFIKSKGANVEYYSVDVSERKKVDFLINDINKKYGKINGVIYSAMVMNYNLYNSYNDEEFIDTIRVKSLGTINICESLDIDTLDFMVFFSSGEVYGGNPALGAYGAACNLQDAYGYNLNKKNVYIINWGFWKTNGDILDKYYKANGIYPIETKDGLEYFYRVLINRLNSLMVVGVKKEALIKMGVDFSTNYKISSSNIDDLSSSVLNSFSSECKDIEMKHSKNEWSREFENYMVESLFLQLRNMGMFERNNYGKTIFELKDSFGIIKMYNRLFDELLRILVKYEFISIEDEKIILKKSIDYLSLEYLEIKEKELTKKYPSVRDFIKLFDICIKEYPKVLIGQIKYQDILFKKGRKNLVENIYSGNDEIDIYNKMIAIYIKNFINICNIKEINKKIKILEIGAGTGGTSKFVLEAIEQYKDKIEYVYTDISRSFLDFGREKFKKYNNFIKYEIFDVEKNYANPLVEEGSFDIVICTNVLHATDDINEVLKNIKDLMKVNGVLLINELVEKQMFTTLTFGITDGWWRYKDENVRIEGSPIIDTIGWKSVLNINGFKNVTELDKVIGSTIQNVFVAYSNGIVRNYLEFNQEKEDSNNKKDKTVNEQKTKIIDEIDNSNYYLNVVRKVFSNILKIPEETLDNNTDFSEYGVDSIVIVEINRELENEIGQINPKVLLENSTIGSLANALEKIKGNNNIVEYNIDNNKIINENAAESYFVEFKEDKNFLNYSNVSIIDIVDKNDIREYMFSYGENYRNSTFKAKDFSDEEKEYDSEKLYHLLIDTKDEIKIEMFIIGNGKPLLMIPAIGLTAPVWINQLGIDTNKYKNIIIHQQGYGLSDVSNDISDEKNAELFMEVLDTIGINEKLNIISSCFGGVLGQHITVTKEERVATFATIGGFYQNFGLADFDVDDMSIDQLLTSVNFLTKVMSKDFKAVKDAGTYEKVDGLAEQEKIMLSSQCCKPIIVMRYLMQVISLRNKENVCKIKVPTFVYIGTNDTIVNPLITEAYGNLIPNSIMLNCNGGGHYPFITHSNKFNYLYDQFINNELEEGKEVSLFKRGRIDKLICVYKEISIPLENGNRIARETLGELFTTIMEKGIDVCGAPMIEYSIYEYEKQRDIKLIIPVNQIYEYKDIKFETIENINYISMIHMDKWDKIDETNEKLLAYCQNNNITLTNKSINRFITNILPDSDNNVSEVMFLYK